MAQQTTNEKGRPAGNEATHMQTERDSAPASGGVQVSRVKQADMGQLKLTDAPCLCGINAAGQCFTCRHWLLAYRMVSARRAAAQRGAR